MATHTHAVIDCVRQTQGSRESTAPPAAADERHWEYEAEPRMPRLLDGHPVAPSLAEYSSAENQDEFVHRYVLGNGPWTFVEFGGLDGYFYSNTLALEESLGWTGLLIEPDPLHVAMARGQVPRTANWKTGWPASRKIHRSAAIVPGAVGASHDTAIFFRSNMFGHSGISGEVEKLNRFHDPDYLRRWGRPENFTVTVFPLGYLLDNVFRSVARRPAPDYLSADCEGCELDIFRGFDFARFPVKIYSIEIADRELSFVNEIRSLFSRAGYLVVRPFRGCNDDFYVRKDLVQPGLTRLAVGHSRLRGDICTDPGRFLHYECVP